MQKTTIATITRWTARVMGILVVGVFVLFFFGEGVFGGDFFKTAFSLSDVVMFTFAFVTLGGIIFAWKYERTGALFILLGVLLFGGFGLIRSGNVGSFGMMFPPVVIGLLRLVSVRLRTR